MVIILYFERGGGTYSDPRRVDKNAVYHRGRGDEIWLGEGGWYAITYAHLTLSHMIYVLR